MRRLYITTFIVCLMSLCSCLQNDGHIGHWFGQWLVERITIDGADDADYQKNRLLCFQSHVLGVRYAEGGVVYGSWKEDTATNTLTITFNTKDSTTPNGLHFDYSQINANGYPYIEMRIVEINGKTKKLEYVNTEDGRTYVYYLKKW